MITITRTLRRTLMSRGMKFLIALVLLLGAFMLYLLSSASADTPLFSSDLPLLLGLGVGLVLVLMLVVGYQLLMLRRRLRARVFGSKLTLRLVLLFALVAVLPGALVYGVSVQFLSRSIESWFDVRVDKALEGGLSLGRVTLENMLKELRAKAESMTLELTERSPRRRLATLNTLREKAGVHEATLFGPDGSVIAFSGADPAGLVPELPSPSVVRQVRMQQPYSAIEAVGEGGLQLRVLVPVNDVSGATSLLHLVQPVPPHLARDAQTVQEIYRDYQELSLSRQGLRHLFALTLTLSLLLALLSALSLAIVFSERLSAPLGILAAGTRAVAQGDFSPRHTVKTHDELGLLTESFNMMTMQLADARAEAQRNQEQLATAKAYLESVLGNLSTGVMSFDSDLRLRSANLSAVEILGVDVGALIGMRPHEWAEREPRLAAVGQIVHETFRQARTEVWEQQAELSGAMGRQVLLLRGSRLAAGAESGMVLVFDDITRLLQAQRLAAWGEVAQRLAHEIKNPLTPIQLSAERLQRRLADKLSEQEAEILQRSTQTIVNQVAALKGMVDAFSQYARSPQADLQPLDLNRLIRDVLGLYESSRPALQLDLAADLPHISGDAAKLRQVIHNLLQNAEQAVAEVAVPRILLRTDAARECVRFTIQDNGPGFPEALMGRVFEPYVTTKAKGTGLGLAIVRKIVEEHSGSIAIVNLPSSGASVAVTLPLAPAEAAELRANRLAGR
ncbi:MAG TPA: ATP-binding protein [Burkholderiales bacterium]|jgi:nitrogen fixation/metabolism regulation signal transduction histidine kinase|nr:ATP-binding protein [Burkholderiales bacterium]